MIATVPSGGSSALVFGITAPAAVGILGGAATYSAIAVAAGGRCIDNAEGIQRSV